MRTLIAGSTCSLIALLAACGVNAPLMENNPDMAMMVTPLPDLTMKAPPDLTIPVLADLAVPKPIEDMAELIQADAGPKCGTDPNGQPVYCANGEECCVGGMIMSPTFTCAKSCGDGGIFALKCTGPEGCGGNPCCIALEFSLGGGGGLKSAMQGCGTMGANSCPPDDNPMSGMINTRFCHRDGDCGGGGFSCCSAKVGGGIHVCLGPQTQGLIGFLQGVVTCP